MIASGSDDFADVLVPLLTSDDSQVRLELIVLGETFRFRHLGQTGDGSFELEGRVSNRLRTELRHERGKSAILEELASTDPSSNVREAALQSLAWLGETDAVSSCHH